MKPKGRPRKLRRIANMPKIGQFSPRGRPGRPDEAQLTLDQLEALRLADYDGLDQESAAGAMAVSRATFGRILREARKIVSGALVNGKIIRIYGGDVDIRKKTE